MSQFLLYLFLQMTRIFSFFGLKNYFIFWVGQLILLTILVCVVGSITHYYNLPGPATAT